MIFIYEEIIYDNYNRQFISKLPALSLHFILQNVMTNITICDNITH